MECRDCTGTGRRLEHRSRWIGGGKHGYRSEWEVPVTCQRCEGSGIDPDPTPPAAAVVYCGAVIDAPGFTSETFMASLNRARARATMPMIPARTPGAVLVESVRSGGARYVVTRASCDCPGGRSHGYCMHRAAVIAAHDLYGIDVCSTHVLGFDPAGHVITAAERSAQLQEVA